MSAAAAVRMVTDPVLANLTGQEPRIDGGLSAGRYGIAVGGAMDGGVTA